MNEKMKNLIIFDIDGTLTQTNQIDSFCFSESIKEILQVKNLNTDWSSYQYSTDSGLLREIYREHFNRDPSDTEIKVIQHNFLSRLNKEWLKDKSYFAAVPGADSIFEKIKKLRNWDVGIATGGWQISALFKLDTSRILHDFIPKAYADHHIERTEIIKKVIHEAKNVNIVDSYQRIIYVGDRSWDKKAARDLGIEFVGIGSAFVNDGSSKTFFIENYSESDILIKYLS